MSAASADLATALATATPAIAALRSGVGLDRALERALADCTDPALDGAVHDLAYTATRHRAAADALIGRLARRPPDPAVAALLNLALALLLARRYPPHTVVDQAVRAARFSDATAAAGGFVNALLRTLLRQIDALVPAVMQDAAVAANLPAWWLARLQADWPHAWRAIVAAQQQHPPLALRVNTRRTTPAAWLEQAAAAGVAATPLGDDGVLLAAPRPVHTIPGFEAGLVSVQDGGAQLAARWLDLHDGLAVLDACAAPGGKTAHMAELADTRLVAADVDRARAGRIGATLERLGLRADVRVADVAQPGTFALASFDRILLDAPCTASGIVRRHPDIPWLRRDTDIAQLAARQQQMLDSLWPALRPGGKLVYVVCSLFPEEGERQIEAFLHRTPNARPAAPAAHQSPTLQLLPTADPAAPAPAGLPHVHDGFFYALLQKSP